MSVLKGGWTKGLYGWYFLDKPTDKTQYYVQGYLGGFVPPVGAYHRMRDDMAYMDDYLKNRGFDYDYIKYPTHTAGYNSSSGFGSSMRYVSRNIEDLYDDISYRPRKHYHDVMYG